MSVGDVQPVLVDGTSTVLRAGRRRGKQVSVLVLAACEILFLSASQLGLLLASEPLAGVPPIDQSIVAFGSVALYGLLSVCLLAVVDPSSRRDRISLLRPTLSWAAAIALVGAVLLLRGSPLAPVLPLLSASAALGFVAIAIGRSTVRACLAEGFLTIQPRHRALIFGADAAGSSFAECLAGSLGDVEVVGFIDDRATRVRVGLDLPILGKATDVRDLIDRYGVSRVLIALPKSAQSRIRTVSDQLQMLPVSVFLAVDGDTSNMWSQVSAQQMAGIPVAKLADWPLSSRFNWLLKSAEDKIGALLLTLLFGPLMLMIALAIKLDSPGPVLYRQIRSGFNGRPFGVFKFRTMHASQCDATNSQQTVRGDPRVTRLGRLLRRYSLDELPQVFNALNGTMSLVGPRPHPVNMQCAGRNVSQFVDNYMARNRMRPGITGLAQINGWRGIVDSEAHMQARMRYDLAYIDNWSIWLDLRILSRSFLRGWRDPMAG